MCSCHEMYWPFFALTLVGRAAMAPSHWPHIEPFGDAAINRRQNSRLKSLPGLLPIRATTNSTLGTT